MLIKLNSVRYFLVPAFRRIPIQAVNFTIHHSSQRTLPYLYSFHFTSTFKRDFSSMSSSKQQLTQPTHPCPFDGSAKKSEEAADRNKHHILEILQKYMDQSPLKVLEISSGTGRHVEHFARHFPHAVFQPTEIDADSVNSLNATLANNQLSNIKQPLILDASKPFDTWCLPEDFCCGCVDVIININMIHVSSNAAVDGLFDASGKLLKSKSGLLITYGAYSVDGQITPESNVVFDRKIRSINPEWGLRDVSEMEEKAAQNGLHLRKVFDMPANNKMLIFCRQKFQSV